MEAPLTANRIRTKRRFYKSCLIFEVIEHTSGA
jgi:hypothetical protein